MKLVPPITIKTAVPNPDDEPVKGRRWTEQQLADIQNGRIEPVNWQRRDAVTLVIWQHLTARFPEGCDRALWAAQMTGDIIEEQIAWDVDGPHSANPSTA